MQMHTATVLAVEVTEMLNVPMSCGYPVGFEPCCLLPERNMAGSKVRILARIRFSSSGSVPVGFLNGSPAKTASPLLASIVWIRVRSLENPATPVLYNSFPSSLRSLFVMSPVGSV